MNPTHGSTTFGTCISRPSGSNVLGIPQLYGCDILGAETPQP
jgi:hypothetical protein